MRRWAHLGLVSITGVTLAGCLGKPERDDSPATSSAADKGALAAKLAQYTPVRLTADLQGLTPNERKMLPAHRCRPTMDTIFWRQILPRARFTARHPLGLADAPVRRHQRRPVGPSGR